MVVCVINDVDDIPFACTVDIAPDEEMIDTSIDNVTTISINLFNMRRIFLPLGS